jgi:hypothetical protein
VPESPLLSKTSMRLFWGFGRIIDKYKMARHFDSTVSCRCRSAARSPSVKPRGPGRRGRCPADPDAAGQPVDPGDLEDVALLEEVEDGPEFLRPSVAVPDRLSDWIVWRPWRPSRR